ncbi:MAG: alpha-(1-_3)-arabinofuranosyltransferase domain-containing protein [Ilumatobacteraceae bacterium]
MTSRIRTTQARSYWWTLGIWPVVVLLLDQPGRINADTKYDLLTDPGRLMSAALSTWNESLHGGWVLQQHAGYLWPTGPFFWLTGAFPDWVQQRLWIALIIATAGLGARWAGALLGLGSASAVVAGLVYQLSPYTVPYLSRTSAMLLPWAVAGWVLGTAILATRGPWPRPIAIMALLIASAGGVNSTAIVMITPLPLLWFYWSYRCGERSGVHAFGLAVASGVASLLASAWWVASAVIGSRFGPDLLGFSETLRDVSSTSTSVEVVRGSGYWLTYVVETSGVATSANGRFLTEYPLVVVTTFVVAFAGLIGAFWHRWEHRGFAALCVLVGVTLGVGVHPIDNSSPVGRVLLRVVPDGALIALRSSSRAVPLLLLISAIGVGRLVSGLRLRPVVAVTIPLVGMCAAPWFWIGSVVDPALERPQHPPQGWDELLRAAEGFDRLLVIPGSEFSTFSWGHTQDPPWTSHVDVLTRELLPLGSPDRMDLLLALDDSIQDGVFDPSGLSTVARLLGVDAVWVAEDVNFGRYRTAQLQPDVLQGVDGLELVVDVDDVGAIFRVLESEPANARQVDLWGGGQGALAAANSNLISAADLVWRAGDAPFGSVTVITDGDRSQARQWRTSQATRGATSDLSDLKRDGVQRLTAPDPVQTNIRWSPESFVSVVASSYGATFEFTPEHRVSNAFDGDLATAWLVEDPEHTPVSLAIEGPLTSIHPTVVAEVGAVREMVARFRSRSDGQETISLPVRDDGSTDRLELPADTYFLELTITDVAPGTRWAGISEIGDHQIEEWLVVPAMPSTTTDMVLSRWHVDRPDLSRTDPEPTMRRIINTPIEREMVLSTVGIGSAGSECRDGVLSIDGVDIPIATDGQGTCDGMPIVLSSGEHEVMTQADRLILRDTVRESSPECCSYRVDHAFASGWVDRVDGVPLESMSLVGGATGVHLPPSSSQEGIVSEWSPDRWYRIALLVSAASVGFALVVIVLNPGRRGREFCGSYGRGTRSLPVMALVSAATSAVLVGPMYGAVVAILAMAIPRLERVGLIAIGLIIAVTCGEVVLDRPSHGIAWPSHFEVLHAPMFAALVAVTTWCVFDSSRR